MTETIEVEIRSFIEEAEYERLQAYFEKNATYISKENQETYYLDAKQDLRIQRTDNGTKLWVKGGNIHEDFREEHEVMLGRDDFESLESIFKMLGYKTKIKWFRARTEYDWDGIKVDLDYTRGYGHIVELEIKTDEANKDTAHKKLEDAFSKLKLNKSTKEEFEKRYRDYETNWENLVS